MAFSSPVSVMRRACCAATFAPARVSCSGHGAATGFTHFTTISPATWSKPATSTGAGPATAGSWMRSKTVAPSSFAVTNSPSSAISTSYQRPGSIRPAFFTTGLDPFCSMPCSLLPQPPKFTCTKRLPWSRTRMMKPSSPRRLRAFSRTV
jgi:hypothetical protein